MKGCEKKEKPLVSVIIPCYNNASTIQKSVESIEKQTYNNIEIIICDDCSTDDSINIIKGLVSKHNNIILLKNKSNMKSAFSRNKCIKRSSGQYIAVQDADDISVKNRIEKEVLFLENNPRYSYVSANHLSFENTDDSNVMKEKAFFNGKELHDEDFLIGLPFAHGTVMIRKEALSNVGGYSVSPLTVRGQDYELFLKIHSNGYSGYKLGDVLYLYRADRSAYKRRKYRFRINEFKIRKKYFKKLRLPWYYRLYIVRPLIIGLVPSSIMKKYHERAKT